jgi:hypothetical protein
LEHATGTLLFIDGVRSRQEHVMEALIVALVMLAVVGLGFAIMVGKITPEDGLIRLGTFILVICLMPVVAACLKDALPALKPILILVAVIVVVTVLVKVTLTMKS